jgi:hypothetical protein
MFNVMFVHSDIVIIHMVAITPSPSSHRRLTSRQGKVALWIV